MLTFRINYSGPYPKINRFETLILQLVPKNMLLVMVSFSDKITPKNTNNIDTILWVPTQKVVPLDQKPKSANPFIARR